jgi:GTP-binding protein HflX
LRATRSRATTRQITHTDDGRQRAVVILPVDRSTDRNPALRLEEACGLAEALDLAVVRSVTAPLRQVAPGAFFGSGRIEALRAEAEVDSIDVLVVDASLTPVQQRNLEPRVGVKVIDRTGLILEIFGRRARTREGIVQVELARLAYERSRLVRTWTHLERQRGGLGKTGGPGERQLELDRRLIAQRIDRLKLELEEVRRTRGLQRSARRRAGLPAVVLVGYTNAGKSSLFNRLTSAGVFAKDMPFATLDPTARLVKLPSGRAVILSDTVGFITDLPTELVAAFRATLEEVTTADVLVHVRDIAHPETESQRDDVLAIIDRLSQDAATARPPLIEAWNKIDLLTADQAQARRVRTAEAEGVVAISAATGEGVPALLEAIDRLAFGPLRLVTMKLDPADGRARADLASRGRIHEEHVDADGQLIVTVELPAGK